MWKKYLPYVPPLYVLLLSAACNSTSTASTTHPSDLGASFDLTQSSCSDRVRNGDETDVDCGGSCVPCKFDLAPPLGSPERPGENCQAILAARTVSSDGVYVITAGGETFSVYCDMTRDGGGWTLMLRGRRSDSKGWGTTSAVNLADLPNLTAKNSSKAGDSVVNEVLKIGYRVESTDCTDGAIATTVYFKADCIYQHNTDTSGACQTFYRSSDFIDPMPGEQYTAYQGLSSYTTATRLSTAIIVHDRVSGAGNDSWWSGGPNSCDINVWVK